jgi:hypothetical protein
MSDLNQGLLALLSSTNFSRAFKKAFLVIITEDFDANAD